MKIYNSPINWPTPPPGWQPHEGWHPDPAWGPAPPGHEFWIEVPDTPEQPNRTLTTTALVLAAVALVLFWIPVLNVVGILLGLAAAVLGVISLVTGGRSTSGANGLAITAVAIGGFAVVGAIAVLSVYSSNNGSTSASVSKDTNSPVPSATPAPSVTPSAKLTTAGAGSAANPHPVGTAAVVGDEYQVAILGVKLNATDEVVSNNMFNDPPKGQYVLVDVAVTYAGADEGTPWVDLSTTFVGTDARQYDAGSCGASLTNGAMRVPTLEQGGSATYQVCMDVPVGAVDGGKIFVEKSFSFNSKARTYWAVR